MDLTTVGSNAPATVNEPAWFISALVSAMLPITLRLQPISATGLVSRASPVHTAVRNCTRDEGRPFEFGNQVLISSHRKLLSSKAMVVNVAEKSGQRF
jgi:hypothetical protein